MASSRRPLLSLATLSAPLVATISLGCSRDVLPRFGALGLAIDERMVEDIVHGRTATT